MKLPLVKALSFALAVLSLQKIAVAAESDLLAVRSFIPRNNFTWNKNLSLTLIFHKIRTAPPALTSIL